MLHDGLAFLDAPLDELAFGYALAKVGQFEIKFH